MRRKLLIVVFLMTLVLPLSWGMAPSKPATPDIQVYVSPRGGCTDAIVKEIAAAKETLLVQAYSSTSAPIAKTIVDAHKRGVKVQVILDKGQRTEKHSSATFLKNAGIPTYIDDKHAIAHNKGW